MRSSIDKAGRVVIPKAIRERLGLEGGGEVDITERDGVIEIAAASPSFSLIDRDGFPVVVPSEPIPEMTDEMVRDAIERTRR